MRKAIALLMSILAIIALTELLYMALSLVKKPFTYAKEEKDELQHIMLLKDISSLLPNFLKDINSSEDLSILYNTPLSLNADNNITVDIHLSPAAFGFDVNSLSPVSSLAKKRVELLRDILSSNDISLVDPDFFIAILQDSIDKDKIERMPGSEIVLYDHNFQNGRINKTSLLKIVDYYASQRGDPNVYKLLKTGILSTNVIEMDLNYVKKEIKDVIIPRCLPDKDYISNSSKVINNFKELDLTAKEKSCLNELDVSFFVPIVECQAILNAQKVGSIIYNIKDKKVLDFVFE